MIDAGSAEASAQQADSEIVSQLKSFSAVLTILVVAIALVVLAGWLFDQGTLKSVVPGLTPMKVNAALCFILAGASLILLRFGKGDERSYYVQQVSATLVIFIGLLTFSQYISNFNLGIDQLLFRGGEVIGITNPERMAPNTSFNFVLLGSSLLLIGNRSVHDHRPAQLLALVVVMFAAVAWLGYTTGAQSFEGIASYTRMAVPTTIAFILIASAVLCVRPDKGFMTILTGDNAGSVAARRLLPAALGIPLVLVWLKAIGEQAGLFAYDVGTWLLVLASLLIFALLTWLTVKPLERADIKLKAAATELQRSNAELESFAYIASHDLKQPLRKIASFTQLLADNYRGKLDTEADEFMEYTVDSAHRMQELIDDLLAYSRVGTKNKPLSSTDCDRVCDQAIANLKVSIDEADATVDRGAMPEVMADPTQLEQVFQNLIENAIKFNNGSPPRVLVEARSENREWVFSVHDNGIGIESQYRERIFEIFKRLTTREEHPGTGLGLATCKKVVERHGGNIWVESEPDEGSTFYFSIPVEKKETGANVSL